MMPPQSWATGTTSPAHHWHTYFHVVPTSSWCACQELEAPCACGRYCGEHLLGRAWRERGGCSWKTRFNVFCVACQWGSQRRSWVCDDFGATILAVLSPQAVRQWLCWQVVALAIAGGVRLSDMDSPTQLQKGRFVAGLFALAAVSLSLYDGACLVLQLR